MPHKNTSLARSLLAGQWLERLIDFDGPTGECWNRIESGTMSTGEMVMLAIALELVDYHMPREVMPSVGDLFKLDGENLRRVVGALLAISHVEDYHRGG